MALIITDVIVTLFINIKTLSTLAFSITAFSIIDLFARFSIDDSQYDDIQHEHSFTFMLFSALFHSSAERRYAGCCYTDCRYAGCRYGECRGAIFCRFNIRKMKKVDTRIGSLYFETFYGRNKLERFPLPFI